MYQQVHVLDIVCKTGLICSCKEMIVEFLPTQILRISTCRSNNMRLNIFKLKPLVNK